MHRRDPVRTRTWARALVGVTTVALLGGAFTSAATASRPCGVDKQIVEFGDWTQIKAPAFGTGGSAIVEYAVDAVDPDVIFVSNGADILRSDDGGCTWVTSFSVATASQVDFPGFNVTTTAIGDLTIPESRAGHDTIYAAIRQRVAVEDVAGLNRSADIVAQVIASHDGGDSWELATRLAPVGEGAPLSIAAAPTDPDRVYLTLEAVNAVGVGHSLHRSDDGGATWQMKQRPAGTIGPWARIEVDPLDADHVWAWGNECVCITTDGGDTTTPLLNVPGSHITALDVHHVPGRPARVIAFTGTSANGESDGPRTFYRSDDGGANWESGQVEDPVLSATHTTGPDAIVVATNQPANFSVLGYVPRDDSWRPISLGSFPVIRDLTSDATSSPAVYGNAGSAIVRFEGDVSYVPNETGGFILTPGRSHATIEKCPPPGPLAPWKAGFDAGPPNEPVYATNHDTGHTVRFDARGTGTVVAIAPRYAQGMTLDPLERLITGTRHSNQVTRLFPESCRYEVIDYDLYGAESPVYDYDASLYVAGADYGYVWRYTWPQYPRQKPELVWRMPGYVAQIAFAPPTSPFKGRMFVLYRERSRDLDDRRVCPWLVPCVTGPPNAIAMLERTDDPDLRGWRRLGDFVSFGRSQYTSVEGCEGFGALGMDFLANGNLLVPDICGSGVIREYTPNGEYTDFARAVPPDGSTQVLLPKIAVGASGYVYVTGNKAQCGSNALSEGRNAASWLFRFDPDGRRLDPPFTQHLSCAVGLATVTRIPVPATPGGPLLVDPPAEVAAQEPPRPPVTPPRAAAVAPLAVPPPPIPIPAPVPGPAPVPELAPAPAPNPAPAQAANPMAAAVPQEQEQPQLAFVTASNMVREQVEEQFAMARVGRPADPLQTMKFVVIAGSLGLVTAFGVVSLALSRARARVRIRRY